MSKVIRTFFLVLTLTLSHLPVKAAGRSWNDDMSKLAKSLSALMPMIFDESQFQDPANKELLNRELKVLRETSKSLSMGLKNHSGDRAHGKDPAIEFLAGEFGAQIEFADERLKGSDLAMARQALRPALSYCISCHTRSSQGPSFAVSPFQVSLDKLRSIDKMAIYAATRQYEPILRELPLALRAARGDVYQIEHATRLALAVSVRAKNNPSDAIKVIDLTTATPDLPKSLERELKAWRAASVAWAAEKVGQDQKIDKLKRAEELIASAEKTKTFAFDDVADLSYLRASALLHDYVDESNDSMGRARAFHALGKTYEALRDLGLWNLQDIYFEACIRESPHTPLSAQCFAKLEESLTLGYTGSAGTNVPALIRRKLDGLKDISKEKKK